MSPMASELKQMHNPKFLVYGKAGSGKTTLFRTIPGRKFLYMFDPAGLNAIRSTDNIFFEQFLIDTVPMSVNTLKGVKDSQSPSYSKMETYVRWEQDFSNRIEKGWFTNPEVEIDGVKGGFDAIGFDSLTTLTDLVMDRILELNQRAGKNPELGDYGILANTISRIIRNATSLDIPVYLTAHETATQDKLMRTLSYEIMVPGQLKSKLPLLFSEIYHATASIDGKGLPKFEVATVADDTYGLARCSNAVREAGMPLFSDVTIKDTANPEQYGLGPIIKKLRGV